MLWRIGEKFCLFLPPRTLGCNKGWIQHHDCVRADIQADMYGFSELTTAGRCSFSVLVSALWGNMTDFWRLVVATWVSGHHATQIRVSYVAYGVCGQCVVAVGLYECNSKVNFLSANPLTRAQGVNK